MCLLLLPATASPTFTLRQIIWNFVDPLELSSASLPPFPATFGPSIFFNLFAGTTSSLLQNRDLGGNVALKQIYKKKIFGNLQSPLFYHSAQNMHASSNASAFLCYTSSSSFIDVSRPFCNSASQSRYVPRHSPGHSYYHTLRREHVNIKPLSTTRSTDVASPFTTINQWCAHHNSQYVTTTTRETSHSTPCG